MKSKKRAFTMLTVIIILLPLVLSACGGGVTTTDTVSADNSSDASTNTNTSSNDSSPNTTDVNTEEFEFTIWYPSLWGWGKGSIANGWDDSDLFTYITEKTGAKINFDVPPGTEQDLAGPMIAAGTYPDVVVYGSYNSPFIAQMKEANQLHSWTDLIDQYAPDMWENIPPSVLTYHADADGKLWKYVGFEYDEEWVDVATSLGSQAVGFGAHGTNVIFVRQDILKAYGKDDITDLDDFTEFLRFAHANYRGEGIEPLRLFASDNLDGPRSTLWTHFKSTFGAHVSPIYPQPDNTIKFWMYDPAYKDYLYWLNGLYREGIITQNQLGDDTAAFEQKLYSGNYGAIMSATYVAYNTLETTLKEAYGEDTDKLYVAVGPIQKQGVKWQTEFLRNKGGQATLITNNAKEPDRIINFFNFLLSDDGQMAINGGVEGKQWEWVDGKWVPEPEFAELAASDLEAFATKYKTNALWAPWCKTGYWEGLLGQILTPLGRSVDEYEKRLAAEFVYDFWQDGFAGVQDAVEVGSDLDVARDKIRDECVKASMNMIVAADDATFNKLYDDCLAAIEALGVADIEAVYTEEHQAQLKALGKM